MHRIGWMVLLLSVLPVQAADLTARWEAPTHNTDGTPVSDLAGYRVAYGTQSGQYAHRVEVGLSTHVVLSALLPETTYYVVVMAYDRAGNESKRSAEVSKTTATAPVAPIAPITPAEPTPPQVAITSPAGGGTVPKNKATTITVMAVDDGGVASVRVYVNDTLRCTDATVPYTCSWKVPNVSNTVYRLKAQATDRTGQVGVAPEIRVKTP